MSGHAIAFPRSTGFQPVTNTSARSATNPGQEMLEAAREIGLPVNAEDALPPAYTMVEISDDTHWFNGWVDQDGSWWIESELIGTEMSVKHGIRCHDDMITKWRPKPCGN